jgi:hypothetical protein
MGGTQIKLTGTTPTPAQAKSKLREATADEHNKRHVLECLRERLKSTKEEATAAEAELVEAERVLLAAADDSEEGAAAEVDHGKAWKRLQLAERGIANLGSTISKASMEATEAKAILRSAREDLEAIRLGRRKR